MSNRCLIILFIFGIATAWSSSFNINDREDDSRPNIVFIMADDLGYGDLGCYGQQKIQTPNIDMIAREGMRFTNFYAGSTVCAPSRSVLMTGQHTGHTTVRDNKCKVGGSTITRDGKVIRRMNLTDEDVTVAHVMKNAGYRTGLVGKWHLGGYNPQAGPLNRGFDEFYGHLSQTGHGPAYWPVKWYENDKLVDIPENREGAKGYYKTQLNTDNAVRFIEANQNQPFFLYLSYGNPHSPYTAPDLGPYAGEDWTLEEKTYAAMIYYLDQGVARVIETLNRLYLSDKTVVFFCSDNGPRSENETGQTQVVEFFDSNGSLQGFKRDLYEGGIRVPMIAKWPGRIPAGTISDAAWYFADVLPTAADLAGVNPPEKVDGISVLPAMLDQNVSLPERFMYWEIFQGGFRQAVRWKNWKAIRPEAGAELLLFDLNTDLAEEHNVAAQFPDVIAVIEKYLKTARTESPNWPL